MPVCQALGKIRLAGLATGGLPGRLLGLLVFWHVAGCATQVQTPSAPQRTSGIYHIVQPGENLFRIGKAYDVPYEELARLNRLRDVDQIRAGQRLFIPGGVRPLPVETIAPRDLRQGPIPEPDPDELGDQRLAWPLVGSVTSPFGPRGASFHDGIDIAAEEGTAIRVVEAGEVIYSQRLRGYGNLVIVRHAGGLVSVYAHNQLNLVREGQRVSQGDVIAKVGSTGRVSGPHLHLEIRKNNVAHDPLLYLPELCCRSASDMVTPKNR